MKEKRKVTLPSGAVLEIQIAPFEDAKALYQAILEEAKDVEYAGTEVNFYKNMICSALSSKKIERMLWAILGRCLYNGEKVTTATFEPEEARDDYFKICWEVAEDNIRPFTKSLSAELSRLIEVIKSFQK